VASVKNVHAASDTVTWDNDYDCCKVVVPTLNKVLENFNEVVTLLEHQTDTQHFMYFIWPVLR
jgi:hypothetical protein